MALWVSSTTMNLQRWLPCSPSLTSSSSSASPSSVIWRRKRTVNCTPLQQQNLDTKQSQVHHQQQQQQEEEDIGVICEPCNGRGWLLCDFCDGKKTNVKAENNRIYRRCPSCKAVGYVLCAKCKVFKCVTFPDYDDGGL